jgi:hypothetical protein
MKRVTVILAQAPVTPGNCRATSMDPGTGSPNPNPANVGTGSAKFTDYSGDPGPCGWIVAPRANISTNFSMRLARVSIFFALPIR